MRAEDTFFDEMPTTDAIGYPPNRPQIPLDVPWASYWQALQECHAWWNLTSAGFSIFPPGDSWVGVIRKLRPSLSQDWSNFNETHHKRLLGCAPRDDDNWALLGNMFGTAIKPVFGNPATRHRIETTVKSIITAEDAAFPKTVASAYANLVRLPGIKAARATRLLTLARPDRCVSLNRASEHVLATYGTKAPAKLADFWFSLSGANPYGRLLRRIYQQPWFSRPTSGFGSPCEEEAWSMRVALLDAFIYCPKTL